MSLAEPGAAADAAVQAPLFDWGSGKSATAAFAVAIVFSAYQLWTAAYSPLPSEVLRAIHVGFLLLLLFGVTAAAVPHRPGRAALFWLLGVLGFGVGLYHWVFYTDLLLRAGTPNIADMAVGSLAVVLVFVAGRMMMGWALPLVCAAFLAYGMFGQYLPAPLDHRTYGFDQIIDSLYLGTDGLYGTPTYVSATYIFLFILFGAFLERAGMIRLFTDVALGTVGHTRGGPAKVAVVASGLMGTINGSGVANVVTTGQFTIPLMIRFGYRPAFAGGVEATASMGGQIMPPVMGAVAFIMAETLDIPYLAVVKAAIVPALLYFAAAFWMVHLEAGKRGLLGMSKSEMPSPLAALRKGWFLILPLAALVWLLFSGYTPLFAGTVGLALTGLIILGTPAAQSMPVAVRALFWIALGALSAAAFGTTFHLFGTALRGITVILLALAVLVAANLAVRGGRASLLLARDALAEGARSALPVGVACALVGVIVGILTLTGIATEFARFVVEIGHTSLFISLVMTMIVSLILGMGVPTIPNYIITSSIAGPALLQLGVPLIVGHMFVFYFGIMADLTPPVALAAFAAAPIAKENGMKIGVSAVRTAAAGFIVPYMAVYSPALMLQDGGPTAAAIGYWPAVAYIIFKALLAIGLWGACTIGFLKGPLAWWERLWAFGAAALLVTALPLTDEAGFVVAALFLAWHWWRSRAVAGERTVTP